MLDGDSMGPGLQPVRKGITTNFMECRYFTTFKWPHISVLREATVTWLGVLVVLRILLCWCGLDPIQGHSQGHGAFELPTISEAVHAGGDDRSPLAGLSGSFWIPYTIMIFQV